MPAQNVGTPYKKTEACSDPKYLFDPEWKDAWFEEDDPHFEDAREICLNKCELNEICVKTAYRNPNAFGLRGGVYFYLGGFLSTQEGKRLRKRWGLKGTVRNRAALLNIRDDD